MRTISFTFLLATAAAAQAGYTQLSPATSPSARAGHVAVTDGTYVLLFGGTAGNGTFLNDLWRFDGVTWTNITPGGALPAARYYPSAAWDSSRGRMVLFGGAAGTGDLGDTWEFDSVAWTPKPTAAVPFARRYTAMAFDAARGVCVLFGGNSLNGTIGNFENETWTWNGTAWSQRFPTTIPPARGRHSMVYDTVRGEVICYGGRDNFALRDTWVWNGSTWRTITPTTAPSLFAHAATFDALRERMVVFGGTTTGASLPNTWEFDGATWAQRTAPGPLDRFDATLTYVPSLGRSILFGGFQAALLGDTWSYATPTVATATPSGTNCNTTTGTPTLSTSARPWLGSTFTANAISLAPSGVAFGLLGLSSTQSAFGPLPIALALLHPAGTPGCTLQVSPDATFFLPLVGANAPFTVALPSSPVFVGAQLFAQCVQFDGVALAATNSLALTLGLR